MAKMECVCGRLLSTTRVPNDIQLRVYTDFEWDKILEDDTVNTWEIAWPENTVWRCPDCERIYVFKGDSNQVYRVYKVEKERDENGQLVEM